MKILIAEDQAAAALYLRRTLERLGHEADRGPRRRAGVAGRAERRSPALISDWMMPHLDGPDLCRRIRADRAERYTYIILLTSRDRREDRLKGFAPVPTTFSPSRPTRMS